MDAKIRKNNEECLILHVFNYTERLILHISRFQNALFYIFQGVPNALFYIFQGIRQPIISHIIIPNWFAANIRLISEIAKENSVYFATKPFFCRS